MTTPARPSAMRIRDADRGNLPVLFDLAQQAFCYDTFSLELLGEKLFRHPSPGSHDYRVLVAECSGRVAGFMQAVWQRSAGRGWLGLFAVHPDHRQQGIARALFEHVRDLWKSADIRELEALAIPGNYFNPGLDPRYTEALCFLQQAGFERFKDCVNMSAKLDQAFEVLPDENALAERGVHLRRAEPADSARLDDFFNRHFGSEWRAEVQMAMANDPPGLHLAWREGRIVAFAAHSAQNHEWGFFGPMGTDPAERGSGMGRVLLRRCLNDLGRAGHRTAIIPWVGPIAFYARHAGCTVQRVFWRLGMKLNEGGTRRPGEQPQEHGPGRVV